MKNTTAFFIDIVATDRKKTDLTTCENPAIIENFLKSAEVKYPPSKIRAAISAIGKIFLLLIAPAEYCRGLSAEEKEKIGIKF